MPYGTSIVLEHQPSADSADYAGLADAKMSDTNQRPQRRRLFCIGPVHRRGRRRLVDLVALRGGCSDAGVIIALSSRHINVQWNIVQQRASLRQPTAQSFYETLKSFSSLGLGDRLRICRELRRDREPEANEQREGFSRDGEIALETLDLARKAIKPSGEGGFGAIGAVGRQE